MAGSPAKVLASLRHRKVSQARDMKATSHFLAPSPAQRTPWFTKKPKKGDENEIMRLTARMTLEKGDESEQTLVKSCSGADAVMVVMVVKKELVLF